MEYTSWKNAKELNQLLSYLNLLNQGVAPTEGWFDENQLANVLNQAMNTKEKVLKKMQNYEVICYLNISLLFRD
ncbi:hypothetical protein ACFTAO_37980 [Paenibacillus rhizoplanae]